MEKRYLQPVPRPVTTTRNCRKANQAHNEAAQQGEREANRPIYRQTYTLLARFPVRLRAAADPGLRQPDSSSRRFSEVSHQP